jgi:hypothetical protein
MAFPWTQALSDPRRQVSWLAGQGSMHAFPGCPSGCPGLWPKRCISLAAYSCRDSLGFGGSARTPLPRSHFKPFRAPARSCAGQALHAPPIAECGAGAMGICGGDPPCRAAMGRGTACEASGGGAATVTPKPLRQPSGLPPPHGFATARIFRPPVRPPSPRQRPSRRSARPARSGPHRHRARRAGSRSGSRRWHPSDVPSPDAHR